MVSLPTAMLWWRSHTIERYVTPSLGKSPMQVHAALAPGPYLPAGGFDDGDMPSRGTQWQAVVLASISYAWFGSLLAA